MKVSIETVGATPPPQPKRLADIGNGTFFIGAIDDAPFSGPYLKIGSVTENHWVVARLSTMAGAVWVSSREKDREATVTGYAEIPVTELVLRRTMPGIADGSHDRT